MLPTPNYNVVQQTAPQAVVEHWRSVLTTGQITGHLAKVVALQAEITAKKYASIRFLRPGQLFTLEFDTNAIAFQFGGRRAFGSRSARQLPYRTVY